MQKKTVYTSSFSGLPLLVGMIVLLSLLITEGFSQTLAHPVDMSPPNAFSQRLQARLEAKMQALHVPGAIITIQSAQTGTWTLERGTSDLASNTPIDTDMHFRIGSITKTFVGTVILQLADEGRLHLTDPVSMYEPAVPNGAHITIRELLNMTSGLFNYSEDATFTTMLDGELHGKDTNRIWQPWELLAIAFLHPPYFAPGQGFHYSNTNYILLGLIIEHVTGHTAESEVQRRIFTPLGMTETSMPGRTNSDMPDPHSQGYTYGVTTPPFPRPGKPFEATTINPSWAWTAGDAISTLHDLQIWIKALVYGKLVSAAFQRERLTWVTISGTPDKYGLAIADFEGFIGHNGGLPGYQSFAVLNPQTHATFIILANLDVAPDGTPPADALAKIIINALNTGEV